MQGNQANLMPPHITSEDIARIFFKRICGQEEVWIEREPILITLNYRITDDSVNISELERLGIMTSDEAWLARYKKEPERTRLLMEKKEAILPEREGLYTQSPVIEINNIEMFKKAMFRYVKTYLQKEMRWTRPLYADEWEGIAMYAMTTLWTDATRQDFSNPIAFLERYTDFLTQDQWEDMKIPEKIMTRGKLDIYRETMANGDERETPHGYHLFTVKEDGKKCYFPSICYGLQGDKAFICAIHNLYNKSIVESPELQDFRKTIRGRGVEPLAIVSLISFIQDAKARGIQRIVMPDNFIMQYTTKNKIQEQIIQIRTEPKRKRGEDVTDLLEELRDEKEQKLDGNHRGSLDRRLMALMHVSKYFSTGIKFLEIPGEVSDNLIVDIRDFQLAREGLEIGLPRDHKQVQKIEDEEER